MNHLILLIVSTFILNACRLRQDSTLREDENKDFTVEFVSTTDKENVVKEVSELSISQNREISKEALNQAFDKSNKAGDALGIYIFRQKSSGEAVGYILIEKKNSTSESDLPFYHVHDLVFSRDKNQAEQLTEIRKFGHDTLRKTNAEDLPIYGMFKGWWVDKIDDLEAMNIYNRNQDLNPNRQVVAREVALSEMQLLSDDLSVDPRYRERMSGQQTSFRESEYITPGAEKLKEYAILKLFLEDMAFTAKYNPPLDNPDLVDSRIDKTVYEAMSDYEKGTPKSIAILGDAGSGKTYLSKRWIYNFALGKFKRLGNRFNPENYAGIYSLKASDLKKGAIWMGQAEERIAAILNSGTTKKPLFLFIDEIQTLPKNIQDQIKTAQGDGRIVVFATSTSEEWDAWVKGQGGKGGRDAVKRRFVEKKIVNSKKDYIDLIKQTIINSLAEEGMAEKKPTEITRLAEHVYNRGKKFYANRSGILEVYTRLVLKTIFYAKHPDVNIKEFSEDIIDRYIEHNIEGTKKLVFRKKDIDQLEQRVEEKMQAYGELKFNSVDSKNFKKEVKQAVFDIVKDVDGASQTPFILNSNNLVRNSNVIKFIAESTGRDRIVYDFTGKSFDDFEDIVHKMMIKDVNNTHTLFELRNISNDDAQKLQKLLLKGSLTMNERFGDGTYVPITYDIKNFGFIINDPTNNVQEIAKTMFGRLTVPENIDGDIKDRIKSSIFEMIRISPDTYRSFIKFSPEGEILEIKIDPIKLDSLVNEVEAIIGKDGEITETIKAGKIRKELLKIHESIASSGLCDDLMSRQKQEG